MNQSTLQQGVHPEAQTSDAGAVQPSGESAARGRLNGLRPSQLDVLRALVDAGGSLRVSELVRRHAGAVAVARASTSRSLRRLWRAGLVDLFEKHGGLVDAQRRRGVYVSRVVVTARGIETAKSYGPVNSDAGVQCDA